MGTDRLTLRHAGDDDIQEVFDLLAHSELRFVDVPPRSVKDIRAAIEGGRDGGHDGHLIHHDWVVRRTPDNRLVAFASCNVMRRSDSRSVAGVIHEVEKRAVEPSVYVHPDHQRNGYGPEAIEAIEVFARKHYGATESLLRIHSANARSREGAKRRGATRVLPAGQFDPLETWVRPLE